MTCDVLCSAGQVEGEVEEEVDVEKEEPSVPPVYEAERAVALMDEVENHVNTHKSGEGNPDWEDQIPKYED